MTEEWGDVSVIVIDGIVEAVGASEGADADKGGLEGEGGGGDGERLWSGGEGEGDVGGMREAASHDGGAEGASSTVVPGRREEGSELRCSMNVTWNELKIFLVVTSQRR